MNPGHPLSNVTNIASSNSVPQGMKLVEFVVKETNRKVRFFVPEPPLQHQPKVPSRGEKLTQLAVGKVHAAYVAPLIRAANVQNPTRLPTHQPKVPTRGEKLTHLALSKVPASNLTPHVQISTIASTSKVPPTHVNSILRAGSIPFQMNAVASSAEPPTVPRTTLSENAIPFQRNEVTPSALTAQMPPPPQSKVVMVEGIPWGMNEIDLVTFVNVKLEELGMACDTTFRAVSCSFRSDRGKNWGELEFDSPEAATNSVVLDGVACRGSVLHIKLLEVAETVTVEPHKNAVANINAPGATQALVEGMILFRKKRGKQVTCNFDKVKEYMETKGYNFPLTQIKTKKNTLLVYFNSIKDSDLESSWEHSTAVRTFLGDATTAEDEDSTWPDDESLILIDEYSKRIDMFDNATNRNDLIWDDIVNVLNNSFPLRENRFTRKMVQLKWAALKNQYNKFEDRRRATGASNDNVHWSLFEPMGLVLGGSVTAEPEFTMSVGSQVENKTKKTKSPKRSSTKRQSNEDSPASKKKRLTPAALRLKLKSKDVKTRNTMANALMLMAQAALARSGMQIPTGLNINNVLEDSDSDD